MELTLRAARKLEQQIQNYLDSSDVEVYKTVRVLDEIKKIKTSMTKAKKELQTKISERDNLLQLRFLIRSAISETNEKAGINSAMVTREYLLKKMKVFQGLSQTVRTESWDVIQDEMTYAKNAMEKGTASRPQATMTLAIFESEEKEVIEKTIKELQRNLANIDDNLVVLNTTNKITLTEDHVKLLKSFDLI